MGMAQAPTDAHEPTELVTKGVLGMKLDDDFEHTCHGRMLVGTHNRTSSFATPSSGDTLPDPHTAHPSRDAGARSGRNAAVSRSGF